MVPLPRQPLCLPSLNASLTCRVFDVQKHYWGATIVAHGFRALYMDSDAIVLKNPLPWFSPEYDVQASGRADCPAHAVAAEESRAWGAAC